MKNVLVLFIHFIPLYSFSQNYVDVNKADFDTFIDYKIDPQEARIEGSPYFSERWESGTITLADGKEFQIDEINYNIYKNLPTYRRKGSIYQAAKSQDLIAFTIGDNKFVVVEMQEVNKDIFEELVKGEKIILYKKYDCTIVKGQQPKGYVAGTNDNFSIHHEYYVQKYNDFPIKLKTRKKDILYLFGQKTKEVEAFIKKNNLKTKSEADLILIFKKFAN